MAAVTTEERQMCRKVLSSVNCISRAGGSDSTISGNSTITALINAINALGPNANGTPELNAKIGRGLRLGVLCNAFSETHGFSTIATMRDAVAAQIIPEVLVTLDNELPE